MGNLDVEKIEMRVKYLSHVEHVIKDHLISVIEIEFQAKTKFWIYSVSPSIVFHAPKKLFISHRKHFAM